MNHTNTSYSPSNWLQAAAAISLSQPLVSAFTDQTGCRVYPPTFPDVTDYIIDTIDSQGCTNRCILDTKQSQARRLSRKLLEINDSLPQDKKIIPNVVVKGTASSRRVGEVGHRIADAAILLSENVGDKAREAINSYAKGDSSSMGLYFPDSLLFGFWDSHTSLTEKATHAKRSRIIRSEIFAYDANLCRSKSVFVSEAPFLVGEEEYDQDKQGEKLSEAGLANAIGSTLRDGVLVSGPILRTAEINVASIRSIKCKDQEKTIALQEYLLNLAILTLAWEESDELNLRSGCLLIPLKEKSVWSALMRNGNKESFTLPEDLLTIVQASAQKWFKLNSTTDALPPVLEGNIEKGTIQKVRQTLKQTSSKKKVTKDEDND